MCKEARVNHTTIRYSDKVSEIINSAKGQTFGDRFENICLEFIETKEQKEKIIKSLDDKIKEREKRLSDIIKQSSKLQRTVDSMNMVERILQDIIKECNT